MKVKEECGSGDYKVDRLKLWRGSKPQGKCFPDPTCNYLSSLHSLTSEKTKDMETMYSRFVSQDRWPDYISREGDGQTEHHALAR